MARRKYKVNSLHLVDIAGGAVLEPGSSVFLTDAKAALPHNARLIASGTLFPVHPTDEPEDAEELADDEPDADPDNQPEDELAGATEEGASE